MEWVLFAAGSIYHLSISSNYYDDNNFANYYYYYFISTNWFKFFITSTSRADKIKYKDYVCLTSNTGFAVFYILFFSLLVNNLSSSSTSISIASYGGHSCITIQLEYISFSMRSLVSNFDIYFPFYFFNYLNI